METFEYAWNSSKGKDLVKSLNELGAVGWRLVHLEWDNASEFFLFLVEKKPATPEEEK